MDMAKGLSLLLLGLILIGCSGVREFSLKSRNADSSVGENSAFSAQDLDLLDAPFLSAEDQFEEVLRLFEDALDSAEAGSNEAAQSLYEDAIINISSIQADDLNIPAEDFEWIHWRLVNSYAEFLNKIPELPEESSPSSVYLSLSEFLGDSIGTREELIERVCPDIRASLEADTIQYQQLYPDVPLIVNSYVEKVLKFYQTKGRKVFSKWLERAEEAIPYYTALLREEGMPAEIVYLSMIESGFSIRAYSRAHASGPWQFISSTAKIYGLEVGYWYDERRDPEKSTRAACRYLKKLYDEFGDWYLAFAAYNSGENRVRRALQRGGKGSYWNVRRHLPKQTREYVPSYLAARIICQNPEKYGFPPIELKSHSPDNSETVYVDGCVSFKEIAKCAGASEEEIKNLNPTLKRGCTPPDGKQFPIKIPAGAGEEFNEKIANAPRQEKSEWVRHRIRRGETLSSIAARYGVSMRSIMEIPANGLKTPHMIRAGQYLMIPVGDGGGKAIAEPSYDEPQPIEVKTADGRVRTIYRVRKGDNLSDIAKKFSVQVSDLKTWNHLWGKRYIYPKQNLIIWTKPADSSLELENLAMLGPILPELRENVPDEHLVQPGDTLWNISRLYGVSIEDLKMWNEIRSVRSLQPGMKLKLKP